MRVIASGLAVVGVVLIGTIGETMAAKSPAQEYCGAEWQKMKAAGKTFQGQTWPKFWSQCAKDYGAKNPDATAEGENGGATTSSAAPTESKTKVTKTAAAGAEETGAAEKKTCEAKWTTYKAKSGAHGWHDYFQFMAKCM